MAMIVCWNMTAVVIWQVLNGWLFIERYGCIVHVGWIIVFPPNCYSSTCSQHQFHYHFLLAVALLPWNLVVNYRVFFINCSKIRGSKSLKDWVYEESFVLTFMVITNNFALNSNKGSKLDLIPIFNHVKQKLIIKKG